MFTNPGGRAGRKVASLADWRESFAVASPNATVPYAAFTARAPRARNTLYADIGAAIVPLGVGPLTAAIPNGLASGGNARGPSAVDLQLVRNAANQVAGIDFSGLFAGRRNSIRKAGAGSSFSSAIVGSEDSYIDSSSGTAGTGCFIGGGRAVTIDQTGNGAGRASLGGDTIAFVGASGSAANMGGANITFNTGANGAFNLAGQQNTNDSAFGGTMGSYARTRGCASSIAHGCQNSDGTIGKAQYGRYVLQWNTANATPTLLSANNSAAGALNQVGAIPSNGVFAFTGLVVANSASGVNTASWKIEGQTKYVAGVLTLVYQLVTAMNVDAALAGVAVALGVDTVNLLMTITVTGLAATTIRWGSFVEVCDRS